MRLWSIRRYLSGFVRLVKAISEVQRRIVMRVVMSVVMSVMMRIVMKV